MYTEEQRVMPERTILDTIMFLRIAAIESLSENQETLFVWGICLIQYCKKWQIVL